MSRLVSLETSDAPLPRGTPRPTAGVNVASRCETTFAAHKPLLLLLLPFLSHLLLLPLPRLLTTTTIISSLSLSFHHHFRLGVHTSLTLNALTRNIFYDSSKFHLCFFSFSNIFPSYPFCGIFILSFLFFLSLYLFLASSSSSSSSFSCFPSGFFPFPSLYVFLFAAIASLLHSSHLPFPSFHLPSIVLYLLSKLLSIIEISRLFYSTHCFFFINVKRMSSPNTLSTHCLAFDHLILPQPCLFKLALPSPLLLASHLHPPSTLTPPGCISSLTLVIRRSWLARGWCCLGVLGYASKSKREQEKCCV